MSKNIYDLEIPVKGHSMSLNVIPFDTLYMVFYYVFYSNVVPKTHRF